MDRSKQINPYCEKMKKRALSPPAGSHKKKARTTGLYDKTNDGPRAQFRILLPVDKGARFGKLRFGCSLSEDNHNSMLTFVERLRELQERGGLDQPTAIQGIISKMILQGNKPEVIQKNEGRREERQTHVATAHKNMLIRHGWDEKFNSDESIQVRSSSLHA